MPAISGYDFTISIPKAASDRTRLFQSRQEKEKERERCNQERTYGIMFAIRGFRLYVCMYTTVFVSQYYDLRIQSRK